MTGGDWVLRTMPNRERLNKITKMLSVGLPGEAESSGLMLAAVGVVAGVVPRALEQEAQVGAV